MAVYAVIKQSNHDLSPAEVYGELKICFPLGISHVEMDSVKEQMTKFFQDFDFKRDYFLPIGSPILVCVASMVLNEFMVDQSGDSVNLLEWCRGEYVPHVFQPFPE